MSILYDCFLLIFYFSFFGRKACEILVLWPGMEPIPLHCKCQVLTTGHQGSPYKTVLSLGFWGTPAASSDPLGNDNSVCEHRSALLQGQRPTDAGSWLTEQAASFLLYSFNFRKVKVGLPWRLSDKESAGQCRRHGFHPWTGRIPHAAEQLASVPWLCNPCSRAQEPQLLKLASPEPSALQQRKPLQQEALTLQWESSPQSPQLQKSPCSKEDPAQPKNKNKLFFFKKVKAHTGNTRARESKGKAHEWKIFTEVVIPRSIPYPTLSCFSPGQSWYHSTKSKVPAWVCSDTGVSKETEQHWHLMSHSFLHSCLQCFTECYRPGRKRNRLLQCSATGG